MQFFLTVILSVSLPFFNAHGAVWEDTQAWNAEYEREYAEWLKSPVVKEAMFTDINSPYHGINPDCADAAYAIRAVFAYEKKLPFVITAPSGSRDGKTLNNRMSKWDSAGSTSEKRLVAMIAEIGDSVGTESLAYFDTYPTSIKSITAGSLFMYKVRARFGRFIRHAYTIKNVNPVGTFETIYSTQANKKAGQPLLRKKSMEFENLPQHPWGFKKFRWPELLGKDFATFPSEVHMSAEQYDLATHLGPDFFKHVTKTLATTNETLGERVNRSFEAVCSESLARINYVNQALEWLAQNDNRCMEYEEFDAYSTPKRDSELKDLFEKLKVAYREAENAGEIRSAHPEIVAFTRFIFTGKASTNAELLARCPVNYRPGISIDLATLWKRIEKEQLSSHPNDMVELRWGEKTSSQTRCKRWY